MSHTLENIDDLFHFAESECALSVRTSDLRFGTILRAARMHTPLRHDASFSEILKALLMRSELISGVRRAIVDQLRLLARDIRNAAEYSVSTEIQDIALALANSITTKEGADPRAHALVFSLRYGLLGDEYVSFDAIGARQGFSGKNAAKIVERLIAAKGVRSIYAPACTRLLLEIEQRAPCAHELLQQQLSELLGHGLSLSSALRFLWDFLDAPRTIHLMMLEAKSAGAQKVLTLGNQMSACQYANKLAIQAVSQLGAAQTYWLAAKASQAAGVSMSAQDMGKVLGGHPDFEWLNEEHGWFWFGPEDSRNRALQTISKIATVKRNTISLEDLGCALLRARQENAPLKDAMSLPPAVLKAILQRVRISSTHEDSLSESEQHLAHLCRQAGGMLSYAEAYACLVDSGLLKEVTLNKTLNHSPIFERLSEGIYRLIGWPIDSTSASRAHKWYKTAQRRKGARPPAPETQ